MARFDIQCVLPKIKPDQARPSQTVVALGPVILTGIVADYMYSSSIVTGCSHSRLTGEWESQRDRRPVKGIKSGIVGTTMFVTFSSQFPELSPTAKPLPCA